MKINSTQNPQDSLYHDARTLLGINLNDTTTLSVGSFIRSANHYNQELGFYAWRNSAEWNFDDANKLTLAEASTDLVIGQEDYAIPISIFDIKRVAVQDEEGNWADLQELRLNDIGGNLDEFCETDSFPLYWFRYGPSIKIKPAAATGDVTTTLGLKIWVDRESDAFTVSETSTQPGFPTAFHRLLSYGPAIDFAQSNGMNNLSYLISERAVLQSNFEQYHSKRSKKNKPRINNQRLDTI